MRGRGKDKQADGAGRVAAQAAQEAAGEQVAAGAAQKTRIASSFGSGGDNNTEPAVDSNLAG